MMDFIGFLTFYSLYVIIIDIKNNVKEEKFKDNKDTKIYK